MSNGTYWIGHPHEVELLTGSGMRVFHVTGNTLIWQRGDLALRLETDLGRPDALALAGLPG